jgi:hypothetical protein
MVSNRPSPHLKLLFDEGRIGWSPGKKMPLKQMFMTQK